MLHIMNVTERVSAKLKDGYMELYFHKELIGTISFSEEGKQYDLQEGYVYEEGQILKVIDASSIIPGPYVEGCDLGWC
ncbi:hypothetical protein J2S09_003533 [Bacillus fengqiuensis]|nr:hypothetical protein [Bacillus fengqiuensis]